jgi:hypothetical protein
LWQRVVQDSGPTVVFEGLSLNAQGSLVVGGTEQRADGNWNIVLARYDSFGNLIRTWRYTPPSGYRCAALQSPVLLGSAETRLVGQLAPGGPDTLHYNSSLLFARFTPEGSLLQQSLFDTGSVGPTMAYDVNTQIAFVVTGQAGKESGQHSLMVLHY